MLSKGLDAMEDLKARGLQPIQGPHRTIKQQV